MADRELVGGFRFPVRGGFYPSRAYNRHREGVSCGAGDPVKLHEILDLAGQSSGYPDWDSGACQQTDPEAYFPDKGQHVNPLALITCRRCSIRAECLAYALDNGESYGVWGGASEKERRKALEFWESRTATPAVTVSGLAA